MKSVWKITSNYIGEEKMYAVYRLRDVNSIDHSGNREYASDYMTDRKDAEALANKLNKEISGQLVLNQETN